MDRANERHTAEGDLPNLGQGGHSGQDDTVQTIHLTGSQQAFELVCVGFPRQTQEYGRIALIAKAQAHQLVQQVVCVGNIRSADAQIAIRIDDNEVCEVVNEGKGA